MFGLTEHEKLAKAIDAFMAALANTQGVEAALAGGTFPTVDRAARLGVLWGASKRCCAMRGANSKTLLKALKSVCLSSWGGAADYDWLVANRDNQELTPWCKAGDAAIQGILSGGDPFGTLKPLAKMLREGVPTNYSNDTRSLAELLLNDLGSDFPIISGEAKESSPLIISDELNYVGIEYAVVKHLLGMLGEQYELREQRLLNCGDRTIDELIFDAKPIGAADWTGQRRFYFDVTAGFKKLGAH